MQRARILNSHGDFEANLGGRIDNSIFNSSDGDTEDEQLPENERGINLNANLGGALKKTKKPIIRVGMPAPGRYIKTSDGSSTQRESNVTQRIQTKQTKIMQNLMSKKMSLVNSDTNDSLDEVTENMDSNDFTSERLTTPGAEMRSLGDWS